MSHPSGSSVEVLKPEPKTSRRENIYAVFRQGLFRFLDIDLAPGVDTNIALATIRIAQTRIRVGREAACTDPLYISDMGVVHAHIARHSLSGIMGTDREWASVPCGEALARVRLHPDDAAHEAKFAQFFDEILAVVLELAEATTKDGPREGTPVVHPHFVIACVVTLLTASCVHLAESKHDVHLYGVSAAIVLATRAAMAMDHLPEYSVVASRLATSLRTDFTCAFTALFLNGLRAVLEEQPDPSIAVCMLVAVETSWEYLMETNVHQRPTLTAIAAMRNLVSLHSPRYDEAFKQRVQVTITRMLLRPRRRRSACGPKPWALPGVSSGAFRETPEGPESGSGSGSGSGASGVSPPVDTTLARIQSQTYTRALVQAHLSASFTLLNTMGFQVCFRAWLFTAQDIVANTPGVHACEHLQLLARILRWGCKFVVEKASVANAVAFCTTEAAEDAVHTMFALVLAMETSLDVTVGDEAVASALESLRRMCFPEGVAVVMRVAKTAHAALAKVGAVSCVLFCKRYTHEPEAAAEPTPESEHPPTASGCSPSPGTTPDTRKSIRAMPSEPDTFVADTNIVGSVYPHDRLFVGNPTPSAKRVRVC